MMRNVDLLMHVECWSELWTLVGHVSRRILTGCIVMMWNVDLVMHVDCWSELSIGRISR